MANNTPPTPPNSSINEHQPGEYIENFHNFTRETNFDMVSGLVRDPASTTAKRLTYSAQLHPLSDSVYQVRKLNSYIYLYIHLHAEKKIKHFFFLNKSRWCVIGFTGHKKWNKVSTTITSV